MFVPTYSAALIQTDCHSGPDIPGRIDLIVPRVIIMEGRAQLSSRGCGAKVVQRRCLAARCMER